jgi:Cell wall-active antibiotics response 4TMS YvqF
MTATQMVRPPAGTPAPGSRRPAPIVLGLLLVAAGAGWLLDVTGLIELPVLALLTVGLIGIGLVLMLDAVRATHGGLIALGTVLTVVLAVATVTSGLGFDMGAGVGDRVVRPAAAVQLHGTQRLSAGTLTLDLRDTALEPGVNAVTARVGTGRIVVIAPSEVPFQLHGRVAAGEVQALGRTESGTNVDVTITDSTTAGGYAEAGTTLRLDLRVALGEIEVQR